MLQGEGRDGWRVLVCWSPERGVLYQLSLGRDPLDYRRVRSLRDSPMAARLIGVAYQVLVPRPREGRVAPANNGRWRADERRPVVPLHEWTPEPELRIPAGSPLPGYVFDLRGVPEEQCAPRCAAIGYWGELRNATVNVFDHNTRVPYSLISFYCSGDALVYRDEGPELRLRMPDQLPHVTYDYPVARTRWRGDALQLEFLDAWADVVHWDPERRVFYQLTGYGHRVEYTPEHTVRDSTPRFVSIYAQVGTAAPGEGMFFPPRDGARRSTRQVISGYWH